MNSAAAIHRSNYLRQYPVHAIKIDRKFMQEVPESLQAATLADNIIHMAHALDKQVIAEGVETTGSAGFPARARLRYCAGIRAGASVDGARSQ